MIDCLHWRGGSTRKTGQRLYPVCEGAARPRDIEHLPGSSRISCAVHSLGVSGVHDSSLVWMCREAAHRRPTGVRESLRRGLPGASHRLAIDVCLGVLWPVGDPGAVCGRRDDGVRICRVDGDSHQVSVPQSVNGVRPRATCIVALEISVSAAEYTRPGISLCVAAMCVSYGPPGTRSIHVRPPSSVRMSAPASIATNTWPATTGSGSIHRFSPIVGAKDRARLRPRIHDAKPVTALRLTHCDGGDFTMGNAGSHRFPDSTGVVATPQSGAEEAPDAVATSKEGPPPSDTGPAVRPLRPTERLI